MSCNRYFLGNSRHFTKNNGMIMYSPGLIPFWIVGSSTAVQTAGITSSTTPSEADKARRPPNAYILYRKDRHALVKAANPSVTNNEICECNPAEGIRSADNFSSNTWCGLAKGINSGSQQVPGNGAPA